KKRRKQRAAKAAAAGGEKAAGPAAGAAAKPAEAAPAAAAPEDAETAQAKKQVLAKLTDIKNVEPKELPNRDLRPQPMDGGCRAQLHHRSILMFSTSESCPVI
ncbi:unnamed protein product, partial [Prorocentrum cordatum]